MTLDEPLVSVSVPTYNHEAFIAEAIESILSQSYENTEIIIADDCSEDGTRRLIREYAERYPEKIIPILSESREGISKNANKIWRAATGKYVSLMSGDDVMLPGKILRQVRCLEAHKEAAICYHNLDVFESSTNATLYYWNAADYNKPLEGGVQNIIENGTYIGACSIMVRRENAPSFGFDERIPVASDWLFAIQTCADGGEVVYLPEVLARYRRHGNNVTASNMDNSELFRTLDIVESTYPQFEKFVKKGRGRLYYVEGVSAFTAGSFANARSNFLKAIFFGWRNWKSFARLAQSCIQPILKIGMSR